MERGTWNMERGTWKYLLMIFCAVAMLTACEEETAMQGSEFDEQALIESRKQKDDAFRNIDQSPLSSDAIASFDGLHYYAPNEELAVEAVFVPAEKQDTFLMPTSTSELRQTFRTGTFEFTVDGKAQKLNAYGFVRSENGTELFVPFKDATSGVDTYGAGRYLNVERLEDDSAYILDFNEAYNPYCAYNDAFSCPLVPKENVMSVRIEAGEKRWK